MNKNEKKQVFLRLYPRHTPWDVLRFPERSCIFVPKNDTRYENGRKDPEGILAAARGAAACCRRLHVVPGVLDEILIRETGLCGEEIILIW